MSAGLPNPQMNPPQRGWLGRNWKWVIPVGCILPLLVCCGGVTAVFMFALGAIKSSDVYKEAVAKAKANPDVKAAIGEPITEGFMPTGNFDTSPSTGHADLNIVLSGPKDSGTLFAVAHIADGKWVFSKLDFIVASTGAKIDVLVTGPQKK
jgi:Cytochrome oxidase complex assembly protein 1